MADQEDFRSTASPETLKARASLLRQTRAFFDSRSFVEVQTPLLSTDTVVDRHLDPVPVLLPSDPTDLQSGRNMFLQTSPEFLMKRLLASGMSAIYQITPAFRIGESGTQHNPEFTMLEWYRCGDDMHAGMSLLSEFASELLNKPQAKTQTYSHAFVEHAGFEPLNQSAEQLRERCVKAKLSFPTSLATEDWDSWTEVLFSNLVQTNLGQEQPTIIYDYPASQSALAQVRGNVAERFELFVDGIELANGYHELLDANELRQRNKKVNEQRIADGKHPLPEESRLAKAMEHGLPACSGVAVGFDRLLMLRTGKSSIDEVVSFTIDRT